MRRGKAGAVVVPGFAQYRQVLGILKKVLNPLDTPRPVGYCLLMTKNQIEAFAAHVNSEQAQYPEDSTERAAVRDVALWFAVVAENANPRFDRKRFLTACGF